MNSRFLKEPVLLFSVALLFWVAMGIALRSAALNTSNIIYVIIYSLLCYFVCRIISYLIPLAWNRESGTNDWVFGVAALIGAAFFYCHVLLGVSV